MPLDIKKLLFFDLLILLIQVWVLSLFSSAEPGLALHKEAIALLSPPLLFIPCCLYACRSAKRGAVHKMRLALIALLNMLFLSLAAVAMLFFSTMGRLQDTLPADFLTDTYVYELYRDGNSAERGTLADGQVKRVFLQGKAPLSGWRQDMNSYAPEIVFRSSSCTIACTAGRAIVNQYRASGEGVQQSKAAPDLCWRLWSLLTKTADAE